MALPIVSKYNGEPGVPKAVIRRRKSVYDAMRRLGTPFLFKHRYSQVDVDNGVAINSPGFDNIYGRSGRFDTLSHGVGYVGTQLSTNEWYDPNGTIIVSATNPGAAYTQAPLYRGYGPGQIIYCIEGDTAVDYLKVDAGGTVVRVEEPQIVAPWFPVMNDGDILIAIQLDSAGNIIQTFDRFELQKVTPISVRGYDKRGSREQGQAPSKLVGQNTIYTPVGNSYLVNQVSSQNRVPPGHTVLSVETDR